MLYINVSTYLFYIAGTSSRLIMNPPLSPQDRLQDRTFPHPQQSPPVKPRLITRAYLNGCSYDPFHYLGKPRNTPPPCPRFFTFRAVFTFSSISYPQTGQQNIPSAFVPIAPHSLHSLLISFPSTSTISTDCSLHFCINRFRIYPLCH